MQRVLKGVVDMVSSFVKVAGVLSALLPIGLASGYGYNPEPPRSAFLYSNGGCDHYDPTVVDWNRVLNDIINYLSSGGAGYGPDRITAERVAPILIRTAFHDAGAFDGSRGGADGSCMLTGAEQDWDANSFPLSFIPYARAALEQVVADHQISWADAIAVGGIAGAQYLGAPGGWRLRVGRCDSDEVNPEVLPAGNIEYSEFAHYWRMVGISIRDAAALLGIHSAIDDHGGEGDPVNWSNSLYLAQTTPSVVVTNNEAREGVDGVEWDSGVWKYTVNDAHNAPANVQASCEAQGVARCPFMNQFINSVYTYAASEGAWASAYKGAYGRMTEIGAQFSPMETTVFL